MELSIWVLIIIYCDLIHNNYTHTHTHAHTEPTLIICFEGQGYKAGLEIDICPSCVFDTTNMECAGGYLCLLPSHCVQRGLPKKLCKCSSDTTGGDCITFSLSSCKLQAKLYACTSHAV